MALVGASITPATWRLHGKAWEEWGALVGDRDVGTSEGVRMVVTLEYLAQLRLQGVSGIVAQRRLAGVSFHFQLRDWGDVTRKFIIRQALKGWKKERSSMEARRPISFSLLETLVSVASQVCSSPGEAQLLALAFSLAFFGALRIGELVSQAKGRPGGLLWDDVVLGERAVRLRIRKSKTDVYGKGAWVLLKAVPGPSCPFTLVSAFKALGQRGSNFLVHEDGSPLTKYQFTALFKRSLEVAGVSSKEYGTHSFRIGAATEAARAGLQESEVMRIGRWRSSCYARYIRPELL